MLHPTIDTFYTKVFFRDRLLFFLSCGGMVVYGALLLLLSLGFDTLYTSDREYITLHYKILFGTDFVAQWFYIFLIPLAGVVVFALNFFVGRVLYNIERNLTYASMAVALLVQGLLFFGLILLLQVNLY